MKYWSVIFIFEVLNVYFYMVHKHVRKPINNVGFLKFYLQKRRRKFLALY
jgi:hypothetical protein